MTIQEISDRLELKALVDEFSNLADKKDYAGQVKLFMEDAVVNTIVDQRVITHLEGRSAIQEAFRAATGDSQTVFHMNGQQTLRFEDAQTARGISYSLVTLINEHAGQQQVLHGGVWYQDTYKKVQDTWYIQARNTNFGFQLVD